MKYATDRASLRPSFLSGAFKAARQTQALLQMDLTQTESDLLKLLADAWDASGPPGYVETSEVAMRLKISVADAKSAIQSLHVKGLVDTDKVDTFAVYLTPEGYDLVRKVL